MAAARVVFAQHGSSAPMLLISNTAGVSSGVLYRHFPDIESLTRAVLDEDIAALEELAADPDGTLERVLAAFLDQLVDCTAFVATLRPDIRDPAHSALRRRVEALLADKLAADSSGMFDPGVTVDQVVLAIALVASLLTKTAEPARRAVADRAWRLLLDGLRHPPVAPE